MHAEPTDPIVALMYLCLLLALIGTVLGVPAVAYRLWADRRKIRDRYSEWKQARDARALRRWMREQRIVEQPHGFKPPDTRSVLPKHWRIVGRDSA